MERAWIFSLAAIAVFAAGLRAQGIPIEKGLRAPAPVAEASAPVPVSNPAAPVAEREWLFLVFINGVNDLGIMGYAEADINEMEEVGSGDRLAVVAEYAVMGLGSATDRDVRFQRGSRTIYVTRDSSPAITSPVIYSSADADMGSEAALVRFAKRALRRYPAKKVALVLWNHGNGTLGISYDDVSRNHMSVDRLGAALKEIGGVLGRKIDLFATDACLMQMAGVAFELSPHVKVIVGSQENVQTAGYPYARILSALSARPAMDAEALGRVIVEKFGDSYTRDATLSALRAELVPILSAALGNWIGAVTSDPEAMKAAADQSLVATVSRFHYRDSKDLVDYVDKVSGAPGVQPPVKKAAEDLKDFLRRGLVISSVAKPRHREAYTSAGGLSIYMPDLRYDSAAYEKLAFPAASPWGDFVLKVMRERLK